MTGKDDPEEMAKTLLDYGVGCVVIKVGSSASGSTNNSLYFSKGDYLAFREVSLSYMLPLSWIRKMRLSAVEVFAGAYNIGYIKKYDGMFPEIYTGVDYGIYPRPRQYNMGVKINF